MRERIDWIDAVKGTCLFLVIIAHLCHPCPLWTHILTGGYMQVFFVMAGITSVASSLTFREQISQKSRRLLLPYALYGIVLLVLGVILPTQISFGKGLLGLLYGRYSLFPLSAESNIPLLQACGYLAPFWFLPCIFLSYMLLSWYDHSMQPKVVVIIAIIVCCTTPLLPILLPWSIEMSFAGFLLMLCGRELRGAFLHKTKLLNNSYPLVLIWIGSAIIYMIAWKLDGPVNMSLSIMGTENMPFPLHIIFFVLLGLSEALFMSLSFMALHKSFITRIFAYIGRHALRLLCIHLFLGECVYFLLTDVHLPQIVRFMCALSVIFLADFILEHFSSLISKSMSRKKATSNIPTEKY